jgi:hypothetical protein
MQHALGPDITPMPSTAALAEAAVSFNGKFGPLTKLVPAVGLPAHINVPAHLLPLLQHFSTDAVAESYVRQIHVLTGIPVTSLYGQLPCFVDAGWLQRRRESGKELLRRGGGGHRRHYYSLSPAARLVPMHDVLNSPLGPGKWTAHRNTRWDTTAESDHESADQSDA